MGNFFATFFTNPILNILVFIYQGLSFLHIPYALGFSIIILTVVIRFILYPLTAAQLKSSKKMQAVAPHINKLKEKHKGDMKRIQEETMLLYKEHGVNPVAGCLPALIQLPVIWALYAVLRQIVGTGNHQTLAQLNKVIYFGNLKLHALWSPDFFGVSLGQSPAHLIATAGPVVLLVPLLTGLFQFLQTKMMFPVQPPVPKTNNDKKDETDFAASFQSQSLYLFPIMIGYLSYKFQFGLSLYWNTFTIFGIIQQYKVAGLGGIEPWIQKTKKILKK